MNLHFFCPGENNWDSTGNYQIAVAQACSADNGLQLCYQAHALVQFSAWVCRAFTLKLTSLCKCRYRTARLLHTVAMRLRKHTRKLGAFQAWNKCLNHLLELARAHVEAVMLTNILEGANKCEDLDARKSIKVRLLYLKFWSLLQCFRLLS